MTGIHMCPDVDTVAGPDTLDEIHHAFAHCWRRYPEIRDDVRIQMELAATEIAANIVEHSASGRPVRVQMHLEVSADEIRAMFHDDGNPVQVNLDTVQMPSVLAERGRGLAIAVGILDALSYRRGTDMNNWTLTRSLHR